MAEKKSTVKSVKKTTTKAKTTTKRTSKIPAMKVVEKKKIVFLGFDHGSIIYIRHFCTYS